MSTSFMINFNYVAFSDRPIMAMIFFFNKNKRKYQKAEKKPNKNFKKEEKTIL